MKNLKDEEIEGDDLRMRKLKNPKMKTYAKMKGRTTFNKPMILCWKIVANTPKLLTLL